jgi:hypothetical protein
LEGFNESSLDAELTSGQTTFFAEGAVITNNGPSATLVVPVDGRKTIRRIDKRGPAEASKMGKSTKKGGAGGRRLAPGDIISRKVLAVRVAASDGVTTADLATLGGNIFGTGLGSSAVCMRERFLSCSYGELQMNPYSGTTPSGVVIQDGVVQVQIGTSVNRQASTTIQNTVLAALGNYLGISQSNLPNTFDHIMLCLPWGTMGPSAVPTQSWLAYGTYDEVFSRKTILPITTSNQHTLFSSSISVH